MSRRLKECFICGIDNETVLQEHHLIPPRHGGAENLDNVYLLCANCHQAVEKMYDSNFYDELGIDEPNH